MLFHSTAEKDMEYTLFIIGNGFDLYHGIPSKYIDFRQWLVAHQHQDIVNSLELWFSSIKNEKFFLWHDFEKALGDYDQESIAVRLSDGYDRMMDETIQSLALERFCPLMRQVPFLMKNWAHSIDITHVDKKMLLPQESLYITFNYTKVLEQVYNIFIDNIFHLHGSTDFDSQIVVGHRTYKTNGNEVDDVFYHEKVREDIITMMNTFNKDLLHFFDDNPALVQRLHTIKKVFVLGHSLSEIDRPYFDSICMKLPDDAQWSFSIHDDNDARRVHNLMEHLRTFHKRNKYTTFNL